MTVMWTVHWRMNGRTGHGSPIPLALAALACEVGNSLHGAGTHWFVEAHGAAREEVAP